jgi:hypothetical protein
VISLCDMTDVSDVSKAKETATPARNGGEAQDDLDQIGGTTEDDFTEGLANIRSVNLEVVYWIFADIQAGSIISYMVKTLCCRALVLL